MSQAKRGFSVIEAKAIAGFGSKKMIHYLADQGLIEPTIRGRSGKGVRFVFSFGDLVVLKTVNRLLAAGVSVRRLKAAIQKINKKFGKFKPSDHLERYLITDGVEVFYEQNGSIFDGDGQRSFSFVIDMNELVAETSAAIILLPPRKKKTPKKRKQSIAALTDRA